MLFDCRYISFYLPYSGVFTLKYPGRSPGRATFQEVPHASDASAVWDTWGTDWGTDGTWTALQVAKFVLWNFLRQTSMAVRRPTVWNWNLHFGLPHFFLFTDSCLNKRGEYCTNLACGTHGLPGRILDGAIGICRALTLGLVHLG